MGLPVGRVAGGGRVRFPTPVRTGSGPEGVFSAPTSGRGTPSDGGIVRRPTCPGEPESAGRAILEHNGSAGFLGSDIGCFRSRIGGALTRRPGPDTVNQPVSPSGASHAPPVPCHPAPIGCLGPRRRGGRRRAVGLVAGAAGILGAVGVGQGHRGRPRPVRARVGSRTTRWPTATGSGRCSTPSRAPPATSRAVSAAAGTSTHNAVAFEVLPGPTTPSSGPAPSTTSAPTPA